MDTNETTWRVNLVKALKEGVVTVTFEKINGGGTRVMPCTINEEILKDNGVAIVIKEVNADSDHIAAWAIDKEAWRSFRLETVTSWVKGNAYA
jgi:hypothetical protein